MRSSTWLWIYTIFVFFVIILLPSSVLNTQSADFISEVIITEKHSKIIESQWLNKSGLEQYHTDFVNLHGEESWQVIVKQSKIINCNPYAVLMVFAIENNYPVYNFNPQISYSRNEDGSYRLDESGQKIPIYFGIGQMGQSAINNGRKYRKLSTINAYDWIKLDMSEKLMDIFAYWKSSRFIRNKMKNREYVYADNLYLITAAYSYKRLTGIVYTSKRIVDANPAWNSIKDNVATAEEIRYSVYYKTYQWTKANVALANMQRMKGKQYNKEYCI